VPDEISRSIIIKKETFLVIVETPTSNLVGFFPHTHTTAYSKGPAEELKDCVFVDKCFGSSEMEVKKCSCGQAALLLLPAKILTCYFCVPIASLL
jgi:hypothetical protein